MRTQRGVLIAFGALAALSIWPAPASATPLRYERVSVSRDGREGSGISGDGEQLVISADGRRVGFWSYAPEFARGLRGAFLRDRVRHTTTLVSRWAMALDISDDGRFVLFEDNEAFYADEAEGPGLSVRDMARGSTTVIVPGEVGFLDPMAWTGPAALSGDGRSVAFVSQRSDLTPGDTNDRTDVFVRDLTTRATDRLTENPPDGDSGDPVISADGQVVGFRSWTHPGGRARTRFVVRDRATGATLVRRLVKPALLTADGTRLAFTSASPNRVPGDTNGRSDVFVQDLGSPEVYRASVDSRGREANAASYVCDASADGNVTAFGSNATNLGRSRRGGLFVHDAVSGRTRQIYPAGRSTSAGFWGCALSADGRWIAFSTTAPDLVPGDTNGVEDVFVAGPLRKRPR